MIHRLCDWLTLANDIKENNRKIVMFGAGLIGQIIVPKILEEYGLLPYVSIVLDNDSTKWDSVINLCGKEVLIASPQVLKEYDSNTAIFLNISRFENVYKMLMDMPCTEDMQLYITPMILIDNFCKGVSGGSAERTDKPLIPKKIHYTWFGSNPMPTNLQKCIDSWKKYCPDYEIIRHSEANYDVRKNAYIEAAYDKGAYAYVSDFARLDVLYEYGGIYMDTDVELIRSLDDMLYQDAFCGVEKWQDVTFGSVSGSVPGNKTLYEFIKFRENLKFDAKNTCGFYDTQTALRLGYRIDGMTQRVGDMNIYAYDYFLPYDYMSGKCTITSNTYAIHWYNGGWLDEASRVANEKTKASYDEVYEKCQVL